MKFLSNRQSKFQSNLKEGKVLRRIFPHNMKYLPDHAKVLKRLWGMYIVELNVDWVRHKNDPYLKLVGKL